MVGGMFGTIKKSSMSRLNICAHTMFSLYRNIEFDEDN